MPVPERELIRRIRAAAKNRIIGDDCAVLRPRAGHELLVTTDFSLEGVHFRRDWHSPEVVGHRCLTRGLSDIAAMGGEPVAVFLSLALPADLPQKWADAFLRGFLRLARQFDVPLAGGDTAQSPSGVLADVMVVGTVPKGKAVLRSGARAGDRIYVTGSLGGSAATLQSLRSGKHVRERDYPQHFAPMPRVAVGRVLREKNIATAMIDISDGLSVDLNHLCEESGLRAMVDAGAVPLARVGRPSEQVLLQDALHGGDDYELLFTAPFAKRVPSSIERVPITMIGAVVERAPNQKQVTAMIDGSWTELKPRGWEHFRK